MTKDDTPFPCIVAYRYFPRNTPKGRNWRSSGLEISPPLTRRIEKSPHGKALACSEVDDEIEKKNGVGDTVEHDPASAEVVVEERDRDRQNYEIDEQRQHHEHVPVESTQMEECTAASKIASPTTIRRWARL